MKIYVIAILLSLTIMSFFNCKKQSTIPNTIKSVTDTLIDSLPGSYKMSGSFTSGYYGNGTHVSGVITDTTIILTKYDDSTLSMSNNLFSFNPCTGCIDGRYHYDNYYTPDYYCYLSFSKAYTDSLYISSFNGSPAGGSTVDLAGIKIH
jgi:hypothetical protein